jgi:uncharacterized protein (DUF924 family)
MKHFGSDDLESALAAGFSTAVPVAQAALGADQWAALAHGVRGPARGTETRAVIDFWREAGPSRWFAKDSAFDHRFRVSFFSLHERAASGELGAWLFEPDSALALVLLLDQFPRNAFRGSPRMYATDPLARQAAVESINRRHDVAVDGELRFFFYLPFAHSEALSDQERSVALNRPLGQPNLWHAERHRDIVRRFGRFPHRNPILGRTMRPEERRYLDEGGYAG